MPSAQTALTVQNDPQSGSDAQNNGATQLAGFKAAAAEHGLSTLLNGGISNALGDQSNATGVQIAVSSNTTGGPPQSLLAGSLLAAANAISESSEAGSLQNVEASLPGIGQKPSDGQHAALGPETPAPAANPIVDAQTGQIQAGGAAFVTTANTTVVGAQASTGSQAATQGILAHAPVEQVAIHIAKAAADNVNRINIQLDPADLGRVDVKMEVGHDGRVLATIAADRPATLDMLQRDAAGLQRALQDAGLNADGQSLSFSLRQDSGQANGNSGQGTGNSNQSLADAGSTVTVAPQTMINRADDVGLDIRV